MSKPLELTVYPPLKCAGERPKDRLRHEFAKGDERRRALEKRLTEPELAAEYYRAGFLHENSLSENDGYDGMPETREHRHQAATFYRFAALPHYDEAPAG